ncbi:MAG: DUF2892 domain-containing protein [Chloroflexi bacterium]|nr:DUF2892 domain-containing protein [Chloroflexota bacterium]
MRPNEATWDRVLRVILGIVLLALKFTGAVTGTVGLLALIFGLIFLITGLIGFCPLYSIFGFSTKKE